MDPETASGLSSILTMIVSLLIVIGVFYFFVARPQKKKEKANREMIDNIKVGDNVTTIGGIFGTVSGIRDDVLTLDVGPEKAKIMIARWAIRNVEKELTAN